MGLSNCSSISPVFSNNVKVLALESTLQQCIVNFKELLSDYEQLQVECEKHKQQYLTLKHKCESKICVGTEDLKKEIASKDQILQSVASSLTKLSDTKDWNILAEIFKALFNDTQTPALKISPVQAAYDISPNKENVSITEDVSVKEESVCEIEGTPGRTSPIIQTKNTKSVLGKSSDFRDKKKCPSDWPTPESKSVKLTYPTPTRSKVVKLRQSRLNLVKLKQTSVVDLTCSPEFSRGNLDCDNVLPLIKKESMENDDTILPSPTSGPTSFTLLKTSSKDSPSKFKRPALSLKVKTEKCENEPKCDENRYHDDVTAMEDSINILNPLANRFNGIKKENQPVKLEDIKQSTKQLQMDGDATHCEDDSSISLLDHVNQLQKEHFKSPAKCPLAENINLMNTPPKQEVTDLRSENKMAAVENVKRKLPELVEPIYKEPTVRNKQEKRNLQGWSCEQCKNFYGELYKNDPVMLAKKINECSKHRGRHNPERPKTPPNFWNPRWHVPDDTEELNRMNNAN